MSMLFRFWSWGTPGFQACIRLKFFLWSRSPHFGALVYQCWLCICVYLWMCQRTQMRQWRNDSAVRVQIALTVVPQFCSEHPHCAHNSLSLQLQWSDTSGLCGHLSCAQSPTQAHAQYIVKHKCLKDRVKVGIAMGMAYNMLWYYYCFHFLYVPSSFTVSLEYHGCWYSFSEISLILHHA